MTNKPMLSVDRVHCLKIKRKPFLDLESGAKTGEIRDCSDRDFQVGDNVILVMVDETGSPTPKEIRRTITHIQTGFGLPDDLCVLSYEPQGKPVMSGFDLDRIENALVGLDPDEYCEGVDVHDIGTLLKAVRTCNVQALLDKPVQPNVADLLLASAHSYVKVAGETQNLARHLQSRIEVYFDGEPDSKYQVEPVAVDLVHDRAYRDGLKRGFGLGENGQVEQYHKEFSAYQNGIVFAEKDAPAPVAVVMPFAEKVISKLQRFEECASDNQGADIGSHWFEVLTRLELLNRMQRSPATWEITEQGQDVLKTSKLNGVKP